MFGRANEATVEVNGVPTTCLVDTGAIVTIVKADFCEQLGLEVHSIDGLVSIPATGGTTIPYPGYTVATLEFPHIPNYSEEAIFPIHLFMHTQFGCIPCTLFQFIFLKFYFGIQ